MIIGVDFDNTIVCYDKVFHVAAYEKGLIPADLPVSKGRVRDHLRKNGMEETWIEMQGYVYGLCMNQALPYPGVIEFFHQCKARAVPVLIISHKTHHPYQGPGYDLHQAAHLWLDANGFYDPDKIGLTKQEVFFDLTKQEKLNRIAQMKCTHFIDDLPELFAEPAFPSSAQGILFDPNDIYNSVPMLKRAQSWKMVQTFLI